MNWTDQLFLYCERGTDPSIWAEPMNAVSNGAFIIAALFGARQLAAQPARNAGYAAEWTLVALAGLIGVGSFLFHTFATRWAVLTDVGAILIFTMGSIGYVVRRFIGASWLSVVVALAVFVAALAAFQRLPCSPALLPVTSASGRSCLNGTLGYAPVLVALVFYGSRLVLRGHPAGRLIAAAAAVFAISMVLRTVDIEVCALSKVFGRERGTHSLWHVLNAVTVYCLLAAAIRYGGTSGRARGPSLRHRA
jgi:hypothetical protein